MTYGQDQGQPGQYPQPGYGQQYGPQDQPGYGQQYRPQDEPYPQPGYGQQYRPQDEPYPEPGYGQQYRPQDEPRQPQHRPRPHHRRTSGPQEAPWQQAPYPPPDYPPRDQWRSQPPPQDYGQFRPPQRHHRKRSRASLYAGIGAVIVIAAGGTAYALAGHGSKPGPVSSSSPAAAVPPSVSQLKKIVLQPADLPSGWKATAYQPGPNDSASNNALAKCIGAPDTSRDQIAEAHSDSFTLGNATISSSVTSYRVQSALATDIATLRSPRLSPCFGQMMKRQLAASLPAGATVQSVSIKITPGSGGGPANVVGTGTGTIEVSVSGRQVPAYLMIAFIRGPLIEAEVDAENVGSPVSASVVNRLVAKVATRANMG